jgi:uncharacterized protein with PQ loop repeat
MYIKRNKNKNVDRITMLVGMCMPLVTIPQFYDVWFSRRTNGVSLVTWSFFTLQAGIFGVFALRHKERPLVITYIPLFFIELGIVIGLLYYR